MAASGTSAQTMALPRRSGILVRRVDGVRGEAGPLGKLRDKVVMPAAEEREGKDSTDDLARQGDEGVGGRGGDAAAVRGLRRVRLQRWGAS